jgi:hypothetical protein
MNRILDGLISEIAKQRGQEPEEIEETLLRKIDEDGNDK